MNDTRPVLVGVDGSAAMRSAVRYAATIALRLDRGVRLLHVAPEYLPMAAMAPLASPPSAEEFRRIGEQVLADAEQHARELLPAERITTRFATGDRDKQILAEAKDALLVVLGDDREPELGRLVVGSLIAGVASAAPVPVVSVPGDWVEPLDETEPTEGRSRRRIVVGVKDYAAVPDELMLRAFELAQRQHAVLEIVHVWDINPTYGDVVASLMDFPAWQEMVSDRLRAATVLARAAYPEVDVMTTVRHGRPAQVLRDLSRHAELVLVARRRRDVIRHLGSTGRSVLRAVLCPVEVVPVVEVAEQPSARAVAGATAG